VTLPTEVEEQVSRVLDCGMPAGRLANLLRELADEWEKKGRKPFNFQLRIRGEDGKVRGASFDPGERDV
jgi:hypothetical protein